MYNARVTGYLTGCYGEFLGSVAPAFCKFVLKLECKVHTRGLVTS